MTWWVIGAKAAATVGGALISSKGAKDASGKAAKGSERELNIIEESRDLARGDQAPARQGGAIALDALMSMTGLTMPGGGATQFGSYEQNQQADEAYASGDSGINMNDYLGVFRSKLGSKGKKRIDRYMTANPFQRGDDAQAYMDKYALTLDKKRSRWFGDYRRDNPQFQTEGRNYGGAIYSRRTGGRVGGRQAYNVNETGPETVFGGGVGVRNPNPQTIQPAQDGYVQPNKPGFGVGDGIGSNFDGGGPQENPGGVEGGYNFQTDPGYAFRIGEGQRAMERGAAASGGLLSGGYGRKLTRYAQDYASNEYSNVYNRISNIAGLGQVANNASGGYAMQAGSGMGTSAAQAGATSAYGTQAQGNAWANAANQVGQIDWSGVFRRDNKTTAPVGSGGIY